MPANLLTENDSTIIDVSAGLTAGAEIDMQTAGVAFNLGTGIKDVTVNYTLAGVTGKDGAAVSGSATIDSTNGLKLANGKFTVDGDEGVVLTITGVTAITLNKTTAFSAVTGTIDGQAINTVAAENDVKLVLSNGNWVNEAAFTITAANSTSNWIAGSKTGQIIALTNAATTVPVDSTNMTTISTKTPLEFDFAAGSVTFNSFGSAVGIVFAEKA